MMIRECCPSCSSNHFKKNGHLPSGKQSYRGNDCDQQFVLDFEQRLVSDEDRSRLIRATLSFSKKLDNHIGAIKYFLSQYNLELAQA